MPIETPLTEHLYLLLAGFVAGALNVLAGGGSFITLPLLIFLGLPPSVANGTNRVAILLQNAAAVWGFHRYRLLDRSSLSWAVLPATLGAGLGAWLAVIIGEEEFRRILAFLMIAVTIWTLWSPSKRAGATRLVPRSALAVSFFLVGVYGGFVQAGVGFFILSVTTLAGLDLVRGNAVKVATILGLTTVSLFVFIYHGKVDWPMGLSLGAGTILGGLAGVKLTVLKGHRWIKAIVIVAVMVFAFKLWFGG